MKRTMTAGLMAALMLGMGSAAQAAGSEAVTAREVQVLAATYTESAEPRAGHTMEERELHLFPQLDVVDHRRVMRAGGRVIAWGSYPEITVRGDDYPILARMLRNWSMAEKQVWENTEESMGATARELMPAVPYYDYKVVDRWGRVDDRVVSFALRYENYGGGAHPLHGLVTENINVETGEQTAIDEIVTGRDILLLALADAFRKQYPKREEDLFAHDIDDALDEFHSDEDWQKSFNWMLDAHNDLVVFYNPYDIGPYSSGSFELTVQRDMYPEVFYPDFEE